MKEHIDVGLPNKFEMQNFPEYMHISRKWFGNQVVFMTVFALFWNGFLFKFYAEMDEHTDILAKLFPLIHVAVGVCVGYYALIGWFNKTNIFISKEYIEINHKPLPWFGQKRLKSTDIKQLYSKEKISKNRNGASVRYEVHAILHSGTNSKLLSGLENSEQALFVEQEIEKYLDIKNASVRGAIN